MARPTAPLTKRMRMGLVLRKCVKQKANKKRATLT